MLRSLPLDAAAARLCASAGDWRAYRARCTSSSICSPPRQQSSVAPAPAPPLAPPLTNDARIALNRCGRADEALSSSSSAANVSGGRAAEEDAEEDEEAETDDEDELDAEPEEGRRRRRVADDARSPLRMDDF